MSWFPSRGHSVFSTAELLLRGAPLLLLCRRAPTHEYVLCGRLEAVSLALLPRAEAEAEAASAEAAALSLPLWTIAPQSDDASGPCLAEHVVFRLVDAAALLPPQNDVLGALLGGREVEAARPPHYAAPLR